MKAVLLYSYGDPSQLRYEETAVPRYGDDEVLVKMHATSINPIDVKIRSGAVKSRFSIEFPAVLGRDLSGEVAETGRSVRGFPKGMRVMALANGTYAEYTVAKADVLAPIPDGLSFEQAGALPLVTTTGAQLIGQPEGADKYDIHVEAFTVQPDASRLHQLADDLARGEFSIPIARTMKLQEIQEAHGIFERGGLAGKIVLIP
jgi:NADPH:quinone reductase-like Zn-dependent oxidoreductase